MLPGVTSGIDREPPLCAGRARTARVEQDLLIRVAQEWGYAGGTHPPRCGASRVSEFSSQIAQLREPKGESPTRIGK